MKWIIVGLLFLCTILFAGRATPATVDELADVIRSQGEEPIQFVKDALKRYDLLIFDDAIHSAQEPFDFYQKLLRDKEIDQQIRYIFVEVFSIADQPHLDKYFASPEKDRMLLAPVFQNDYSGYGWRYQTYLDLLSTIWDINATLPESTKLKVIGVSQPVYWESIHTKEDYELFQSSLIARDYFMYKVMIEQLNQMKPGTKALFLTNTRHAYKHLKSASGPLHWNTSTFIGEWHPGKAISIHIHNVVLSVAAKKTKSETSTAEGLEQYDYSWVRVAGGLWDSAFAKTGNRPVAFYLNKNAFGTTKYEGNLMLDVAADQTMSDVYDAILFLRPLEELHLSAEFGFIFTPEFKSELKRRITLMEGSHLDEFLKENGAQNLDEFVSILEAGEPQRKSPFGN